MNEQDELGDKLGELYVALVGNSIKLGEFAAGKLSESPQDDLLRWRMTTEALAFFLHCVDRTSFKSGGPAVRDKLLELLEEGIVPFTLRAFWRRDDESPEFMEWLARTAEAATAQIQEADAEFAQQPSLMGDSVKTFNPMTSKNVMGRCIDRMRLLTGAASADFWAHRAVCLWIAITVSGRDPGTQEQLDVDMLALIDEVARDIRDT